MFFTHVQVPGAQDLFADTWVACDNLNRLVLPTRSSRKDRFVGMFYFLANRVSGVPAFDITKLLAADPINPAYGPMGSPHWWGEPWFGYYQSDDRSVLRKHIQMLSDLGVDFLVFDNTNGVTYPEVYTALFQEMETMKALGNPVPKVAFFAGAGDWDQLKRDIYDKKMYSGLWFNWKGKPLIMIHRSPGDVVSQAIQNTFTIRESWAWTPTEWFGNGKDKWPWLDNYPQNFGWHKDPHKPEEMAVETGQHATSTIGRSSLSQVEPPVDAQGLTSVTPEGRCFKQQFERAIAIDPEVVFITGWNEWTATRFEQPVPGIFAGKPISKGGSFFVDEYNAEFSRDIEPAKGLLQDNYYMQCASYIRRFKGSRAFPPISTKTIHLSGPLAQWANVIPEYRDEQGDTISRDHPGWGSLFYKNASGRNDIVTAKVCQDLNNLYFFVNAASALTPSSDANWMVLYLNTDANYKTGWLGYDFVIDRKIVNGKALLEKHVGHGFNWSPVAMLEIAVYHKSLSIKVPKKLIGLDSSQLAIDFKWADNVPQTGDVMSFTTEGDTAPNDRFNYRAIMKPRY